nr:MAG TPA: hypothetical protein [Caudoviricetes sp.]
MRDALANRVQLTNRITDFIIIMQGDLQSIRRL